MEAGQIFGLVAGAAMLILLWPAARRLGSTAPVLRWAVLWIAALAAVMLLYVAVLEPMGVGLR